MPCGFSGDGIKLHWAARDNPGQPDPRMGLRPSTAAPKGRQRVLRTAKPASASEWASESASESVSVSVSGSESIPIVRHTSAPLFWEPMQRGSRVQAEPPGSCRLVVLPPGWLTIRP